MLIEFNRYPARDANQMLGTSSMHVHVCVYFLLSSVCVFYVLFVFFCSI